LALASFAALYFELLVIRYLSTEVRVFTNFKNLPLVASFFGIGLGMILGRPARRLRQIFPFIACFLFLLTRYSSSLHLAGVDVSWTYGLSQPFGSGILWRALYTIRLAAVILGFSALIVGFFVVLGGFVGESFNNLSSLKAYGINLAGSLAGILLFSALSFFNTGPSIWLLVGFAALIPFLVHERLTLLVLFLIVAAVAVPEPNTSWSPYHRIDVKPLTPMGVSQPWAYSLVADHAWYQGIVDLSPDFLSRHPAAEPNRSAVAYYDLPYRLVPNPENVLILGAGAGNDVAGALRHGAKNIDAVEIDPVIVKLGMLYHPEHPYSSPRVTIHVEDARAFLNRTKKKYDLIVFGFLDSTTLLSSFSSLRLDNYVYTLESFREAKQDLADGGTLVLSFATSRSFATDRLYATLKQAFGVPPATYYTGYWVNGVLLVEGRGRDVLLPELSDRSSELELRTSRAIIATDKWPFLYLESRSIPDSIVVVAPLFLLGAWLTLKKSKPTGWKTGASGLRFFFLGMGFLLLETKAVTRLSLLFGSTWIINSVVIGSFLLLAMLANGIVTFRAVSTVLTYSLLLALLFADVWFPYSLLNALSPGVKFVLGGAWVALPVFLSGLIFSVELRRFARPAEALGINLFGAVLGGVLENAVMLGGVTLLSALAIAAYFLSYIVSSESFQQA
jgi:Spermine/spermidine synthase domain